MRTCRAEAVIRHSSTVLGFALCISGCADEPVDAPPQVDLFPVSGVITRDAEPLASALVIYTPDIMGSAQGFGATGVTDAEGRYELEYRSGEEVKAGAPAGKYKVVISLIVDNDGNPLPADPDTPPMMSGGIESIPPPYTSPPETPFAAEVTAGGENTFDFDVKSP